MKKVLSKVGQWFLETNSETIVDGVKAVGKNRLNKKKVALVVTAILAILLLIGVISEETFIKLFSEIN